MPLMTLREYRQLAKAVAHSHTHIVACAVRPHPATRVRGVMYAVAEFIGTDQLRHARRGVFYQTAIRIGRKRGFIR